MNANETSIKIKKKNYNYFITFENFLPEFTSSQFFFSLHVLIYRRIKYFPFFPFSHQMSDLQQQKKPIVCKKYIKRKTGRLN